MRRVSIAGPSIGKLEEKYVLDAVQTAQYEGAYKYVKKFEEEFARYLGVKHAVSLPSCTSAIHLSLASLGVKQGDEVIVPDLTWIASSAPITWLRANPIFADVDETWCLSPNSLEQCITPKTRAIIAVDLYGNMPHMDQLVDISESRGIPLIEDAAEAIGSEYKGRKAGSIGRVGVFSFHGTKTLTTGEGGMLVTNDDDIYRRVLVLRDHGRYPGDKPFWNREVGFKYKMGDLQAAIGLAQLERIHELVGKKVRIFNHYKGRLGNVKGITLNPEFPEVTNSFWMTTAMFDPSLNLRKEALGKSLEERGIETRPFFYPLSLLPAYCQSNEARAARGRNKVSYRIHDFGINLPSALRLTDEEVDYVCDVLEEIVGK